MLCLILNAGGREVLSQQCSFVSAPNTNTVTRCYLAKLLFFFYPCVQQAFIFRRPSGVAGLVYWKRKCGRACVCLTCRGQGSTTRWLFEQLWGVFIVIYKTQFKTFFTILLYFFNLNLNWTKSTTTTTTTTANSGTVNMEPGLLYMNVGQKTHWMTNTSHMLLLRYCFVLIKLW